MLQHDLNNIEVVDSDGKDRAADSARYAAMEGPTLRNDLQDFCSFARLHGDVGRKSADNHGGHFLCLNAKARSFRFTGPKYCSVRKGYTFREPFGNWFDKS